MNNELPSVDCRRSVDGGANERRSNSMAWSIDSAYVIQLSHITENYVELENYTVSQKIGRAYSAL